MLKDDLTEDYDFELEPNCCGGCITVHSGIKVLGFYSIIKTFMVLISGLRLTLEDNFFGVYLIGVNAVFILQSYWYFRWFLDDDLDTRRNVERGFKYVLIQTVVVFIALMITLTFLPSEWLPDRFEDSLGNEYELPQKQKQDIKEFMLYFVGVFGSFYCIIQFYFWHVSK